MKSHDAEGRNRSLAIILVGLVAAVLAISMHQSIEPPKGGAVTCSEASSSIVFQALRDNRAVYLANFWATMGLVLGSIGWLVSAEKARNYLAVADLSRHACLYAASLLWVAHVAVLADAGFESKALIQMVESCPGIAYFEVRPALAVSSAVINSVLFSLLWTLIYRLPIGVSLSGGLRQDPPES